MAARPPLFKTITLLVIFAMVMANFNVAQAQDGPQQTPTDTPQAEVTEIPDPAGPVEAVETPPATQTPPSLSENSGGRHRNRSHSG